jgi:hypothetical protein
MPSDQSSPRVRDFKARTADDAIDSRLAWGIALPCAALLLVSETLLYARGFISRTAFWISLPLDVPFIYGLIRLMAAVIHKTSHGFAQTVYSGGNLAPEPAFSAEESMIIRGRLDEAEASLRSRWQGPPPLYQAGLRLAQMLVEQGRADEAVAIFEELRRSSLPAAAAITVANRLIDLHHKAGRTDRLKVELARFASDYKGSGAGEHAGRRLRELKEGSRKRDEEAYED